MLLLGGNNAARDPDVGAGPPRLVVAHEDYGQIWRMVDSHFRVRLELNVQNRWYDEDLQPRRTIRIGLWSGEEQGLLGSRAWVANHPELQDRISAYLNVDNGTGRIRGIWDQSNEAAIPIFEQILWPFRDLGVVAVRHGNTGGTDHLAFDAAGIPGFNFIQDPIEYSTRPANVAMSAANAPDTAHQDQNPDT